MPRRIGTNKADIISVNDLGWIIRGKGGDDEIYSLGGRDDAFGGNGNDTIQTGGGDDYTRGGKGNDTIYDTEGWNDIRGGVGDDLIGGTGQVCGGPGNDRIEIYGGIYYGDDVLGLSRGDDTFHLDAPGLAPFFPLNSLVFGGQGADRYEVEFANDGIATRLDVLDFRQGEGDSFDVMVRPPSGQLGDTLFGLQEELDTNGDRVLDGRDPWSEYGMTWADPVANAVCLRTPDGDMIALWGTQAVQLDPLPVPADFLL